MGLVKFLITSSSISLIIFLLANNYSAIDLNAIVTSDHSFNSIIWGIGIVFFSLISFASVSPDFIAKLRNKQDLLLASVIGVFVPGVIVTILGAILFFDKELAFESLIGPSSRYLLLLV